MRFKYELNQSAIKKLFGHLSRKWWLLMIIKLALLSTTQKLYVVLCQNKNIIYCSKKQKVNSDIKITKCVGGVSASSVCN